MNVNVLCLLITAVLFSALPTHSFTLPKLRAPTRFRVYDASELGKHVMASQKKGGGAEPYKPMTQKDASRIQSTEARSSGGKIAKGSFAARAQSAADKRAAGTYRGASGGKGSKSKK